MALISIIDHVTENIDSNNCMISLFIDLSKAFYTIDNKLLIKKLNHYGIRSTHLKLFRTYLQNRHQFVSFNNDTSSPLSISCGVLHGSILGPILFLIYINDIACYSKALKFLLFADDTTISLSGKDICDVIDLFNQDYISGTMVYCK